MAAGILYLSRADIESLALTPSEVEQAVEAAFRGLSDGSSQTVPKLGLDPAPATFFHAMPARLDGAGTVGIKWVGVADNSARGLPHINAVILLNDLETATLRAVMDGDAITEMRPAAVSMVAARRLARPDSRRVGFVACGRQARRHLEALTAAFPIREVTCYSRRIESAQAFARDAQQQGLAATAVSDPRAAIEGQDIVVTSVPRSRTIVRFLDPAWLAPGAFVSATDLARCWNCTDLRKLEILATDDRVQSQEFADLGHLPWAGGYDADLCELVTGARAGRRNANERAFFVHPGLGLGDIAVASMALERARAKGIGRALPR